MPQLPTLRRELIGAGAIVFAGALAVAAIGIQLVVPRLDPLTAAMYVLLLLSADVLIFSWLGALLLSRRVLRPLDELVASVEDISSGALSTRLPRAETLELARLSAAVEEMARRLLTDQRALSDNIRSLDETNRLLTEARDGMIQAEKLASVGRLAAGIAHEVGNPLGAIMGYLGLIGRKVEPPQRELVDAAEREARRIDRIVRGLLDYARPREAAAQAVDAAGVVADTLDLVRTQGHFTRLQLEQDIGADLLIQGDPYQLQQVLVNLLVNAADAVEDVPDPRITVRVARRAVRPAPPYRPARRQGDPVGIDYSHRRRLAPPIRFRTGDPAPESGEVIEISVADNGPGVPPDMIDKIFEPFVTTKEPGKGTGLGLALCVRLIEAMGGTVNAANRDEGGAVFSVVMPALPVAAADASLAPADASHHA